MGLQGVGSSLYLVPATVAVQLVRRTVLTLARRLRATENKLEEHQRMSVGGAYVSSIWDRMIAPYANTTHPFVRVDVDVDADADQCFVFRLLPRWRL
jgi:hypothetical protein